MIIKKRAALYAMYAVEQCSDKETFEWKLLPSCYGKNLIFDDIKKASQN
jgi:hypothetical protein